MELEEENRIDMEIKYNRHDNEVGWCRSSTVEKIWRFIAPSQPRIWHIGQYAQLVYRLTYSPN